MKYCLITFRSVTPAQRGEQVLRKAGIESRLSRTPRPLEEKGCGYSLQLRPADGPRAAAQLHRQQIPFRKMYLWDENGMAEELEV